MSTIVGIGVDIEEINRFKNVEEVNINKFLNKIFTENEIEYCFSKKDPYPSLTARFCGKEAVVKAFSHYNIKIPLNRIEILNNPERIPFVRILNDNSNEFYIQISLSHSEEIAIAFAIASENSEKQEIKNPENFKYTYNKQMLED